jgi:putative ABC transport system substrate-binding protein
MLASIETRPETLRYCFRKCPHGNAAGKRSGVVFGNSLGHDVVAGGLISYGVDLRWCYRRGAYFVDKILHGTPPGELPVEFPTKMVLSINLKTAKALGMTVPASLLDLADEVIE